MWRSFGALFLSLALSASSAWAQSQVRIVRLSYVEGDVQLDRNDGQGLNKAFLNLPVVQDAMLATGHDGYAEVEFEDGSTLRLTPDSEATFPDLTRYDHGTKTSVWLQRGQAYFNLKHSKNDDFSLRVGSDICYPNKKSHFRVSLAEDNASLALFDGDVRLRRTNGLDVNIRKHETLSLSPDDSGRYFLAKNLAVGPDDDWDSQREQQLEALDQSDSDRLPRYRRYPGLGSYGAFQTVSGYGDIWRPYGMGYDWDPFQNGAWVSYPYAGNVWVSYAPWGWTTCRYGNWVFIPGMGWAWRPGPGGNYWGWNTTPVIVNAPFTFHPPQPPPITQHPIVIVGRPPRDFDGDHRWSHEPRPPVVAGAPRPDGHTSAETVVSQPATNSLTTTTASPNNGRVERAQRVTDTPVMPAQTVIHPVQVRPVRPERMPSQPSQEHLLLSPQVQAPAPHHAPPPSMPAQHYTPPPAAAPHFSPPPAPVRTAPAASRGDRR